MCARPHPAPRTVSAVIKAPPDGTAVTTDGPALTCTPRTHPEPLVYNRVALGVVHSMLFYDMHPRLQ